MAIYPRGNVFTIQATHTVSPELVSEFFFGLPFHWQFVTASILALLGQGYGLVVLYSSLSSGFRNSYSVLMWVLRSQTLGY